MARGVRLDLKGLEEVATSRAMQQETDAAAEAIADAIRGMGIKVGAFSGGGEIDLPVEVHKSQKTNDMTVNRAQARVTLAHPAGDAVQAKRGALTKGAAQAGLTVKDKR